MALIWRFCVQSQFLVSNTKGDGSINLRKKSPIIVDYKYKEIPALIFKDVKLWLKEGDYLVQIFIQVHSFNVKKDRFLLVTILCSIQPRLKISIYLGSAIIILSYLRF